MIDEALDEVALTEKEIAALAPHEYSDLMPPSSPEDYARLRDSIKSSGLLDPIVLYQGKILDGKHRQKACDDTGVKPRYVQYEGDDPVTFVIAKNVARRHLTTSQKAIIASEIEPLLARQAKERQSLAGKERHGQLPGNSPEAENLYQGDARDQAAALVGGVSGYTVGVSKAISKKGASPELINEVKVGHITLNAAKKIMHLPPEKQKEVIDAPSKKERAQIIAENQPAPGPRARLVGPGTAVVEALGRMPPGINADELVRKTEGPRGDTRREIEAIYGKPIPRLIDPTSDDAKSFVEAVQTVAGRREPEYAAEQAAKEEAQFVSDKAASSISVRERIERMEKNLQKKYAAEFETAINSRVAQLMDDAFHQRGSMHDSLYYPMLKLLNQQFTAQQEVANEEREKLVRERELYQRLSKDLPTLVTLNEYRLVRSALHVGDRLPDEERRRAAFNVWQRLFPDWLVKRLK